MKIFKTREELQKFIKSIQGTIGFVPTMGALHEGHASLLREARRRSDIVILSIFVNPTQFNDPKDLEKYPRTEEADCALAEKEKVDILFYPTIEDLYPNGYVYSVTEKKWSRHLCGAFREGHFDGVLTIVLKLFHLVQPQWAFFGEKDFQQLTLIQGMVEDFFLPITIIPCPTLREADGLAMSSRNVRLKAEDRKKAPLLYQCLKEATTLDEARDQLQRAGFKVEYLEEWKGRRLVAAFLGEVRLIDNVDKVVPDDNLEKVVPEEKTISSTDGVSLS